ncbi:MAG: PfkB family carbohydrate kinase [Caldimicrobium sp.]|nr:PfkB family carbohydrate kinase [Caldimicrobium sp.]MDW8182611.1 PfkB family carbohydrate kinase [Caldimicrobium sp.]
MWKQIVGCGALNWDIFFYVEDLTKVSFEGVYLRPGHEYVLERKAFLELLAKLKEEALLVFEGGGGSSANTIYGLSKIGFKTAFLGAVGADLFGKRALEELKKVSINTEKVRIYGETSLAIIILDRKRDRAIVVSPGTAEKALCFQKEDLFSEALYHLSSFASSEGISFQKDLLAHLDNRISLDPGEIYSSKGKAFLAPFIEKTDFLFITERELRLSELSLDDLLERKVRTIFIKRGSKGAMACKRGFLVKSSVYPASKIVDNTGAGDYFNAGVLAGISLGLTLEHSLELGLIFASLSLRDFGRSGTMNYHEFKKSLNELK